MLLSCTEQSRLEGALLAGLTSLTFQSALLSPIIAAGSKFKSSRLKSVLISLVKSLLFLSLFIPLRGLLCPVPGVLGVAGRPGVCGVHGV